MTKATFSKALIDLYDSREIDYFWRCIREDISDLNEELFQEIVQRLLDQEPIDYITGWTYFLDFKLKVNRHVLIPRPETEELVMQVVQDNHDCSGLSILDIGTGSGCIAISLMKKMKDVHVTAIDIDSKALKVAEENAVLTDSDIDFLKLDFLTESETLAKYDIIISNPPYIAQESERQRLSNSTFTYEPDKALYGPKDDHLQFYKEIARFGRKHLTEGGKIYLELNPFDAKEIAKYYEDYPEIELIKDLQGKERMLRLSS